MSPKPPRSFVDRRTYTPRVIQPNTPKPSSSPVITPSAQPVVSPEPAQPEPQPYDFIMNPEQPPTKRSLPGGDSKVIRVLYILGGLLIIMIVLSLLRGLFSSGPNLEPFITVAQDQQELIHLSEEASRQQDLSIVNKNLAATAELSLRTSQSQLITYLATNKKKVDAKVLNLKVSPETDQRLTTAAAATTYNQTFKEIMQTRLQAYASDLNQAYKQTEGPNGRALLKDNYAQAQLLLKLLDTPTT